MNRRDFLKRSLLATGGATALGSAWPHQLFAVAKPKLASDVVTLGGPARLRVNRLAMGTGSGGWNHHSNQTRKLGVRGVSDLFRLAYDNGVAFWDSADQYGSHPHLREALRSGIPRDRVTILTKTRATTEAEVRADLDRFRRELGTDYLDILLLHCLEDPNWPEKMKGVMNAIGEARERGVVRTHGVSCHTLPALQAAAKSPWVQVNLARINPAGVIMDADVPTVLGVLRQMKAAGKGVIGMKILGAGQLREHRDEALQYALSLDCIDCFTIGSESAAEFTDLTKRIAAAGVRA